MWKKEKAIDRLSDTVTGLRWRSHSLSMLVSSAFLLASSAEPSWAELELILFCWCASVRGRRGLCMFLLFWFEQNLLCACTTLWNRRHIVEHRIDTTQTAYVCYSFFFVYMSCKVVSTRARCTWSIVVFSIRNVYIIARSVQLYNILNFKQIMLWKIWFNR